MAFHGAPEAPRYFGHKKTAGSKARGSSTRKTGLFLRRHFAGAFALGAIVTRFGGFNATRMGAGFAFSGRFGTATSDFSFDLGAGREGETRGQNSRDGEGEQ